MPKSCFFQGNVARNGGHAQARRLVGEQHQTLLGLEEAGQKLGVAGKAEVVGLGVFLADGGRHEGVEQAGFQVAGGGQQALAGGGAAGLAGLAGCEREVFVPAGHGVVLAGGNVGGLAHLPEGQGLVVGAGGEVVEEHGGRAVKHRRAQLEQALVEEGFINDFRTNAGQVADGNTNAWKHLWDNEVRR